MSNIDINGSNIDTNRSNIDTNRSDIDTNMSNTDTNVQNVFWRLTEMRYEGGIQLCSCSFGDIATPMSSSG